MGTVCSQCTRSSPPEDVLALAAQPPVPPLMPPAEFLPADLGSRQASKSNLRVGTSLQLGAKCSPAEVWQPNQGQYRTLLEARNNGFAMKNFAARRMERLDQYYETNERISPDGRLGCVRRAQEKKTGLWYAVRDINKEGVKHGMAVAHQKVNEEIRIMRALDHPNIVHLHESFEDRRKVHLVFELCEGGQLLDHICLDGHLTESATSSCIRQMFLAVNYLHQNLVVHRNLKCESWLLAKPGNLDHAVLKLADFHHCRCFLRTANVHEGWHSFVHGTRGDLRTLQ